MEGEFKKVAARTSETHQERTLMLVRKKSPKILFITCSPQITVPERFTRERR